MMCFQLLYHFRGLQLGLFAFLPISTLSRGYTIGNRQVHLNHALEALRKRLNRSISVSVNPAVHKVSRSSLRSMRFMGSSLFRTNNYSAAIIRTRSKRLNGVARNTALADEPRSVYSSFA